MKPFDPVTSTQLRYARAVEELEGLGIMPTRMPALEPTIRALDKAGLLARIDAGRNVVIAGTNGKGTTAAALARLLHSAGQRVGLYTSPHLVTTRERIRVAEEDLSEELFVAAYEDLRPLIAEERLTHFEALTLIAASVFHSGRHIAPVDWAVWEVGLGGLYDATNAIPHRHCAITRLGLDHQAILGSTLTQIAVQKFGVIGQNAQVVHSPMPAELEPLREETAARTGCRWIAAKPVQAVDLERLSTPWGEARSPLPGARAAENLATALTLFESLGFDPSSHLPALSEIRWPGRFSRLAAPEFACPVYLSGDHNPQGIESLLEILARIPRQTLHLVVGFSKDKDVALMLDRLASLPRTRIYLTETPFKPLPLQALPERLREQAVLEDADPVRLLKKLALRVSADDLLLVTGSLYLVGEILRNRS